MGIIIVIGCVVKALIVSFILVSGFTMLVAWLLGFLEVMTLKKVIAIWLIIFAVGNIIGGRR